MASWLAVVGRRGEGENWQHVSLMLAGLSAVSHMQGSPCVYAGPETV